MQVNPLWTKFIFRSFANFQQVLVKLTYLQNHLTYFDYFFKELLLRKLSYFNTKCAVRKRHTDVIGLVNI